MKNSKIQRTGAACVYRNARICEEIDYFVTTENKHMKIVTVVI